MVKERREIEHPKPVESLSNVGSLASSFKTVD
jgi:hypothetical protein